MTYNTVANYKDHFADILADVTAEDPTYADNIVRGFLEALNDWLDYHQQQADAYTQLRERVRQALTV